MDPVLLKLQKLKESKKSLLQTVYNKGEVRYIMAAISIKPNSETNGSISTDEIKTDIYDSSEPCDVYAFLIPPNANITIRCQIESLEKEGFVPI